MAAALENAHDPHCRSPNASVAGCARPVKNGLCAQEGIRNLDPVVGDAELANRGVIGAITHLHDRQQPVELGAQLDVAQEQNIVGHRRHSGNGYRNERPQEFREFDCAQRCNVVRPQNGSQGCQEQCQSFRRGDGALEAIDPVDEELPYSAPLNSCQEPFGEDIQNILDLWLPEDIEDAR